MGVLLEVESPIPVLVFSALLVLFPDRFLFLLLLPLLPLLLTFLLLLWFPVLRGARILRGFVVALGLLEPTPLPQSLFTVVGQLQRRQSCRQGIDAPPYFPGIGKAEAGGFMLVQEFVKLFRDAYHPDVPHNPPVHVRYKGESFGVGDHLLEDLVLLIREVDPALLQRCLLLGGLGGLGGLVLGGFGGCAVLHSGGGVAGLLRGFRAILADLARTLGVVRAALRLAVAVIVVVIVVVGGIISGLASVNGPGGGGSAKTSRGGRAQQQVMTGVCGK